MPSFQEIKNVVGCFFLLWFVGWLVVVLFFNFETALHWVTGLANCGFFL